MRAVPPALSVPFRFAEKKIKILFRLIYEKDYKRSQAEADTAGGRSTEVEGSSSINKWKRSEQATP